MRRRMRLACSSERAKDWLSNERFMRIPRAWGVEETNATESTEGIRYHKNRVLSIISRVILEYIKLILAKNRSKS